MLDKTPVWKKFVKGIFLLMFQCIKVIQMHTVLPAVLKQWWKTKEKKEKTKKKRKTMMIKEYTYKKRKRGEDYAIQALILFVPKTEIS